MKRAPGALTRNRNPPEQPLSSPATRCPAAAHAASGPRRRRSCARHHDAPLALCRAAHAPDQRANAQDAAAAGSGSSDESDDSDEEEVVTRKAMGHEGLMDTVRRARTPPSARCGTAAAAHSSLSRFHLPHLRSRCAGQSEREEGQARAEGVGARRCARLFASPLAAAAPALTCVVCGAETPMEELAGRAKREIDKQQELEREAQETAKGVNEEGAANLARLEEVRRRRAEAAAKREEEAAEAAAAAAEKRGGAAAEPELDLSVEVESAEDKKSKKKSSKSKKSSKKGGGAERPKITVPPPKEMKAALMRLQVTCLPGPAPAALVTDRRTIVVLQPFACMSLGTVLTSLNSSVRCGYCAVCSVFRALWLLAQGIADDSFLKKNGLKKASGNKLAKMKRAEFEKIMADFQENAPVDQLEEFMEE